MVLIADQDPDAPGAWRQPRPVGVTGKIGPEMSTVEDCGGTPTSFRKNPTMLPGSYRPEGAPPFSDFEWNGGIRQSF